MSDIVIKVKNLGKRYRIGAIKAKYKTFRDSLVDMVKLPFQRIARLLRGQVYGATDLSDTIWAIKDLSFEVKRGEVVGIIGRNGAGKSTLLKMLSRITEPTEGLIKIKGRVGSLLEVGTGFHPELTGRENVFLNGAILGMRKREIIGKFDEIIAFAEIEKFIDTPVKFYSSGMYVRLAFAVAAYLEPDILLVDEVLAVGDVAFQQKCMGKMGEVAREGRTVLFVSHNMAAVLNLCEKALLLENGKITKTGKVDDVINCYLMENRGVKGKVTINAVKGGTTKDFRFCSVAILKQSGEISSRISLIEGFHVRIEYEFINPVKGANIVFHLWNNQGVCILTSTDVDQNPNLIVETRKPGRYIVSCFVPPEYLRSGRYFLGVSSSIPRVRILADLPRLIAFDVIDTGSIQYKVGPGREGVISPILKWNKPK